MKEINRFYLKIRRMFAHMCFNQSSLDAILLGTCYREAHFYNSQEKSNKQWG